MSRQMYFDEEAQQFFPVDDEYREAISPPQTNADKIRAASDEMLARFIIRLFVFILEHGVEPKINYTLDDGMGKNLLSWLKSPVEVDN